MRDAKVKQMQQSLEAAMADKQQYEDELQRVRAVSDVAAGKKPVQPSVQMRCIDYF